MLVLIMNLESDTQQMLKYSLHLPHFCVQEKHTAVSYARLVEQPAMHANMYDEAPSCAVHSVLSAKVGRCWLHTA